MQQMKQIQAPMKRRLHRSVGHSLRRLPRPLMRLSHSLRRLHHSLRRLHHSRRRLHHSRPAAETSLPVAQPQKTAAALFGQARHHCCGRGRSWSQRHASRRGLRCHATRQRPRRPVRVCNRGSGPLGFPHRLQNDQTDVECRAAEYHRSGPRAESRRRREWRQDRQRLHRDQTRKAPLQILERILETAPVLLTLEQA